MHSYGTGMYSVAQGRVSEEKIGRHLEKAMPYITQLVSVQFGEMPVQVSVLLCKYQPSLCQTNDKFCVWQYM